MSVNFESHGGSALGERMQSALDAFLKASPALQAHIGTTSDQLFSSFGVDGSGIYIVESQLRLIEINSGMDSITRVREFFTAPGGEFVSTVIPTASFIFAFGQFDQDSSASVWRFDKGSLSERFKDFDNFNGIDLFDAIVHGTGFLLLCSDSSGTIIFVIDSSLALTSRHRYSATTGNLFGSSVVPRPSASSYIFSAVRTSTSTVMVYVEVDNASFDVNNAHTLTFSGVSIGLVLKAVLSGDILIVLLSISAIPATADTMLVAVDISSDAVLWAKRIEGNAVPSFEVQSISADGSSVYLVGRSIQTAAIPNSMMISQLAIADGSVEKVNFMRSHADVNGILRQAIVVGSDLWFAGQQNTEQQNEITITAFDSATTYNVTIGPTTVSQVGTTDANTTASNLRTACDASSDPGFAALIWSVLSNVVSATGPNAFVLSASVTGGAGTISNAKVTNENTFGGQDLQVFKTDSITDNGASITISDITTPAIATISITKTTPADTSGSAVDNTCASVTGYQIAPSTFTI